MRKFTTALFFACFACSFSPIATSAPIVLNNSFESPAVSPSFTTNVVDDWTATGFVGNYGVDSKAGASLSGANGPQYFYGDGQSATEVITQDLGVAFAPFTQYTVDLSGAYRSNCCGSAGVVFGLESSTGATLTGATEGHIALADEVNGAGTFVAASAGPNSNIFTFTTGAAVPTGDIVAFIGTDGNFTGGGRLTVDDFILSSRIVP